MTLGCNRNHRQFPRILGYCNAKMNCEPLSMNKILQETQVCLNRTQEHKHQTANRTIYYLARGFEGLQSVTQIQQNFFLH